MAASTSRVRWYSSAIVWAIVSVSALPSRSTPWACSRWRIRSKLTRSPFAPRAASSAPSLKTIGWMFSMSDEPVVGYRLWPMPADPRSESRRSWLNTSWTRPAPFRTCRTPWLAVAIPLASWPRCWRARRPRYRYGAAPLPWSETPTMPQNSCGGIGRPERRGAASGRLYSTLGFNGSGPGGVDLPEERRKSLGRFLFGDALLFLLLFFLLLALAVLLVGRGGCGGGGGEGLGLREDLGQVHS